MATHNVLLVDDERDNLDLLERAFRGKYKIFTATGGPQALEVLRAQPIDLMITDFRMPGMDGVQLMEAVREINPHVVRIVLTGHSNPSDIIASINRGEAYRYLTKPFALAELLRVVQTGLESYDLRRERDALFKKLKQQNADLEAARTQLFKINEGLEKNVEQNNQALADSGARLDAAMEQVSQLSRIDTFTGLWNHRYFLEVATQELVRATRFKHQTSLFLVEVDQLEEIGRLYGSAVADKVILRVAKTVQKIMRGIDVVGRHSAERFEVLLPQTASDEALPAARRLLAGAQQIETSDVIPGQPLRLTLSIGSSTFPQNGSDSAALESAADKGLQVARRRGKNRVESAFANAPPAPKA